MGTGLSRLTFDEGLSLVHFVTSDDTKSNVCILEAQLVRSLRPRFRLERMEFS